MLWSFQIPSPRDNWPPRSPNLSKEQEEVLDREIHALMDKGEIEPAQDRRGFFSPMFAVPKKDGGWRPIINLKRLNAYLHVSHFKMEGIPSLKDILQQNDYMGKIDLQDAYLTVLVDRKHCNYLKFHRFQSLLLRLAMAPRVFTKILRPLAAKMRRSELSSTSTIYLSWPKAKSC